MKCENHAFNVSCIGHKPKSINDIKSRVPCWANIVPTSNLNCPSNLCERIKVRLCRT